MTTSKARHVISIAAVLALVALTSVAARADSLLIASNTPNDGITGHAYDRATGQVYTSTEGGSVIVGPGGAIPVGSTGSLLDLAFAGGYIWAGESNLGGGVSLARIDPATGAVLNEYDLGQETVVATGPAFTPFAIPFMAMGVAWDGTGLWLSNNAFGSFEAIGAGVMGTSIAKYTWDQTLDALTLVAGSSFTPWMDFWDFDPTMVPFVSVPGRTPGGLAWDTATGRLLIGTDNGEIYSYDPNAQVLSGAPIFTTLDAGYVQGLETVPEPGSFLLLGSALAGCLVLDRRRRK